MNVPNMDMIVVKISSCVHTVRKVASSPLTIIQSKLLRSLMRHSCTFATPREHDARLLQLLLKNSTCYLFNLGSTLVLPVLL